MRRIFIPCILSISNTLLHIDLILYGVIFFLSGELPLTFLMHVHWCYCNFYLPKNVFILPLFLLKLFCWIWNSRLAGDLLLFLFVFYFNISNMLSHYLLIGFMSDEKSGVFLIIIPLYVTYLFSSGCFKMYCFSAT